MADEEPNIRWLFDDDPRAQPGGSKPPLGLWAAAEDRDRIPDPRDWLLGTVFARGFLSSLVAEGGTGKTALRIAQSLALATGRKLTGEYVHHRCRVLYVSLEDDAAELKRRVRAAVLHYGIDYEELRDWLYLATPSDDWDVKAPLSEYTLAYARYGEVKIGEFLTRISAAIHLYKFDLVVIDPFVKLHSLNENSNAEIDFVCRVLSTLAIRQRVAIDVPHHMSKLAADPVGSRSGRTRGASAFRDAARLLYTLSPMTADEAAEMNVDERERRSLVRVDPGKINIASTAADATWFKLIGVNIQNGNDAYPKGDEVQTVQPWIAPDIWRLISPSVANQILDVLDAGLGDGRRFSVQAQVAEERHAWRIVREYVPTLTETQAKLVLRKWQENALIDSVNYTDPGDRKTRKGVIVLRRPGDSST